jgi:membrane protease YdiL (CAAX protease family)
MVLATFVGGLFFGYLYNRDDSLVGVSIVHYVFGAFIFAVI